MRPQVVDGHVHNLGSLSMPGSKPGPRRPPNRYSDQEIDRCLLEVAVCGGNVELALQRLEASGDLERVPARGTLISWRDNLHAQRYAHLHAEHSRAIEDIVVRQARETAMRIGEVEREALEHVAATIHKLDPRDASTTLRNLSTSKALQLDKIVLPLTGRPSQITQHVQLDDLVGKLQALGVVEGSAEEMPEDAAPAELEPAAA